MRDILSDLKGWQRDGRSIALATVVQTWGSSPRGVGAKMGLTSDGKIAGSVSGGCVENAVVEAGIESLKTNHPQLLHFGVADERAWEVGLACGGSIEVFVNPLDTKIYQSLYSVLNEEGSGMLVTVIRGPEKIAGNELLLQEDGSVTGSIGDEWNGQVLKLASEALSMETARRVSLNDDVEVFLEPILPAPTLVIVGGVHIAIALASLARTLGYRTIMIDPRKAWGNAERFPHVDQLIAEWPQGAFEKVRVTRSTAIVMLTHDPKLDDPAVRLALSSPAFYVGALGSKKTAAKRHGRLLNDGLGESQLARLHAPIGLDIGAQTPEEIALAIMAEVVNAHRKQNESNVRLEAGLHP
jgi:xanthine dehydrogenase accessory factor